MYLGFGRYSSTTKQRDNHSIQTKRNSSNNINGIQKQNSIFFRGKNIWKEVSHENIATSCSLYHSYEVDSSRRMNDFLVREDRDFETDTKRLMSKIQYSYFEPGIWTEADAGFEQLVKKTGSLQKAMSFLSEIANKNLKDEHVLEGILHILSNYSYEEIAPYGISIAIACAFNHSLVIQDLLITCLDEWNSVDSIDILKGLIIEVHWLDDYREEVLMRLEKSTGKW